MGLMAAPVDLVTPLRDAATEALRAASSRLKERWPRSESLDLFGNVAAELIAAIEKSGADLVVMGTHGRTGLTHLLLGSTAERIVRTSPVPVLTVRKPR
jgi:nucleotide-binding universal stress UspA family protein